MILCTPLTATPEVCIIGIDTYNTMITSAALSLPLFAPPDGTAAPNDVLLTCTNPGGSSKNGRDRMCP